MNNKILSTLSISMKAGKVLSGEFAVEAAVKKSECNIVIVASDASNNTKKLFRDKCTFYNIPMYVYGTKEQLGNAIGKEMRASVAISDYGLAKNIERYLELEVVKWQI